MSLKRNFALVVINCLILIVIANDGDIKNVECDKSQCRGPLMHYKDLNCKPIYKTPEDCCPYKFDCDHLKSLPKDKCRVNGHDYNIGETLKDEDASPCDIDCTCSETLGIAQFSCAEVDCFYRPLDKPSCYHSQNVSDCCGGPVICPEKPEDRATCEVDGKIYKDGESFKPASEPQKNCYCMPGYRGENVKPFCITPVRQCGADFYNVYDIHNKCAPVYYSSQSPQTECSIFSRCQNKGDKIIKYNKSDEDPENKGDMKCEFGDMVMYYGDELNQATDYSSVCVKCICEVGPVLTCQRLPDAECDITNHSPFSQD